MDSYCYSQALCLPSDSQETLLALSQGSLGYPSSLNLQGVFQKNETVKINQRNDGKRNDFRKGKKGEEPEGRSEVLL